MWYRWVAPESYNATFTTDFSGFDTTLIAYDEQSLNEIAFNDDNFTTISDFEPSTVRFDAIKDRGYLLSVDGYAMVTGDVVLNWAPTPSNDNFSDALPISGSAGRVIGSTLGATKETGEPNAPEGRSVWFVWQAPQTGSFVFDTAGTSFSARLGIFTGTSLDALVPVATGFAQVIFSASAGTTYRIVLDGGNDRNVGDFVLSWGPPPPPTPTVTSTPTNTPTSTLTYTLTASPTRTATPSLAPTITPTPTVTYTLTASPTPSPTAIPTATAMTIACVGDCGGTRSVVVNDIITLVNIALGTAPPSACPNGIPVGAEVDIALIIEAVNNALSSCP